MDGFLHVTAQVQLGLEDNGMGLPLDSRLTFFPQDAWHDASILKYCQEYSIIK